MRNLVLLVERATVALQPYGITSRRRSNDRMDHTASLAEPECVWRHESVSIGASRTYRRPGVRHSAMQATRSCFHVVS